MQLSDIVPVDAIGTGLARPESVLATARGEIFASHVEGVTWIERGETRLIRPRSAPRGFMPNGIALAPDRSLLIANVGDTGGLWRMSLDGDLEPLLLEVDGKPLPALNFVSVDRAGRVWITVSTVANPRWRHFRPDRADGFIVLLDRGAARVVKDGLAWTNEAVPSPDGGWLYVNETALRRTSRFPILANGDLGARETVAQFGAGIFPDGLAFDAQGGFWVVSVISNLLIRVAADGGQTVMLRDENSGFTAAIEAAFAGGTFAPDMMEGGGGERLNNISSMAFCDGDLSTIVLGSLHGRTLARFRSPIAGAPPVHWRF
ncbi:SMP-30/gluconolactonase/LRE family protein [Sphingosinicella microcystinivorans]|uniref:SMP-30/gluconolaconase/LRE-like protein n=1 Tax=Sphingosinicella microcystinivorans TaxID=335406 RepID=A0AAD1D3U7_SPHMI|nr:SMP-30/gluconolactonase/LRE family protein [Sphingosinicella microcystinivorans]RKS85419.1 SMP-30/gluconolaconase/LRE-like protein [Sphingosinicella microcystinivorans]BBE33291.1 hypothetical protein SmB9_09490 [Sphingosinicella microcystinivorans]